MSDDGIVKIHGKDYQTVALRLSKMREQNPEWRVRSKLLDNGMYITFRARIYDADGQIRGEGHASEERTEGGINSTSALENCETSAVGRALAMAGYAGTEIRSADEMGDAVIEQARKQIEKDFGQRMAIVREMLPEIVDLKDKLADQDWHAVAEITLKFTEAQQHAIWLAPTKGGILTTREREQLKSDEFSAVRREMAAQIHRENQRDAENLL